MALLDQYAGTWTESEASHLLRRAGFGGSKADRQALAAMTVQGAVASLVNVSPVDPYLDGPALGTAEHGAPFADLPAVAPDVNDPNYAPLYDLYQVRSAEYTPWLRGHWLYRMRYTTQPFIEQLTLFFHDHMPCGLDKLQTTIPVNLNNGNDGDPGGALPPNTTQSCVVGAGGLPYDPNRVQKVATQLLADQNYLLRDTGLDNFDGLLLQIVRNPAMLVYLDNYLNIAGKPQENLARELMELFSLGVGNYNETDIFQVAKVLTGESFPNFSCANNWNTDSGFIPNQHELGTKTVFGVPISYNATGFETDQVIALIAAKNHGLASPYNGLSTCALYIAWKLITWFANHDVSLSPPDPIVLELAEYMDANINGNYPNRRFRYDIKSTLGKLFRSEYFYDPANRFAMYKTPPDYIIGALRALEADDFLAHNGIGLGTLASRSAAMGMDLFEPPDVSGWIHGKQWMSSTGLIERYNFANQVGQNVLQLYPKGQAFVDAMPPANSDHPGLVDHVSDVLLHEPLTTEERNTLILFLDGLPLSGVSGNAVLEKRRKAGALTHVIMTMPIYQLK